MGRCGFAVVLACTLAGSASAAPGVPIFTKRPTGAIAAFPGAGARVQLAWAPAESAVRYRARWTDASGRALDIETKEPVFSRADVAPGRYQLTVYAIDANGRESSASEALPVNVLEVLAIPPGADVPMPPQRGAYAVGTRFRVSGMHCELGTAPVDDLRAAPQNTLRLEHPGAAELRCAGMPGYLELPVVIAPVVLAVTSAPIRPGVATSIHVTVGSVAALGERLDIEAIGDVGLAEAQRTEFGFDVEVTVGLGAQAGLSVQSGGFELGRVELPIATVLAMSLAPRPMTTAWWALDVGGQIGLFAPPSAGRGATLLGHPTSPADSITSGPLAGPRLGWFPTRRFGLEAEASLVSGGYAVGSGVALLVASRAQLALRVYEHELVGVRLIVGTGAWSTLRERGTSQRGTQSEIHAGVAATYEVRPDLWVRLQVLDEVTSARDAGYAHCAELQLGVMTRIGRRDRW